MNKLFPNKIKKADIDEQRHSIPKDIRSKMSFKEKYGKCNSKGCRDNFEPFEMGYLVNNPKAYPQGYNFALGYATDTIDMIINRNSTQGDIKRLLG